MADQRNPRDRDPLERTFLDETSAAETIKQLQRQGFDVSARVEYVRDPEAEPRQMEDEGARVVVGPGAVGTSQQLWPSSLQTVMIGAVGAVIGLVAAVSLRITAGISWSWFGAIVASAIVAAATIGFVYGGRFGALREGQRMEAASDQRVHVEARPRNDQERRRVESILRETPDADGTSGARREGVS